MSLMNVKADKHFNGDRGRKYVKNQKNRLERRKAKANPENPATYTKHRGWWT